MIRNTTLILLMYLAFVPCSSAMDLKKLVPDLTTPSVTTDAPAPGKRVKMVLPMYKGTDLYHAMYLPTDWEKDKKYPVIVEYSGNKWKNSQGTVDECDLGYGISGGKGVIWICLPFVDKKNGKNAARWWGDVEATVDYCKQTVKQVCAEYGGDSSKLFIAGFSRGAIACNYIGLHDNEIASLWRGFICHSHYDGVKKWGYKGSDKASALLRLKRLGRRPQFISRERSISAIKKYLKKALARISHRIPAASADSTAIAAQSDQAADCSLADGNFKFQALPFPDHTDTWLLRDIPERKIIRNWFKQVLKEKGQDAARGADKLRP